MPAHAPGWAVYVQGAKIDLDDLREFLPPHSDPWVEDVEDAGGKALLLRSKAWDDFENAREVSAQADRLIEHLNGALPLLFRDAKPVSLGSFVKFDIDGKRHNHIVIAPALLVLAGGRMRARVVGRADDATPKTPTQLQKLLTLAGADQHQADLLVHISRLATHEKQPNTSAWFDLYKAAELIRKLEGGEYEFEKKLGAEWKTFKQIWLTANFNRHAPGCANPLPKPPAEFPLAREFIFKLAEKCLAP